MLQRKKQDSVFLHKGTSPIWTKLLLASVPSHAGNILDRQDPLKPDKATKMGLQNMLIPILKYLAASEQIPCKVEETIGNLGHKRKQRLRLSGKRWRILTLPSSCIIAAKNTIILLIFSIGSPTKNRLARRLSYIPAYVMKSAEQECTTDRTDRFQVSQTKENSNLPTSIIFLRICLNRSVKASDFFFKRLRPVWAPFKRAFMMVWALVSRGIKKKHPASSEWIRKKLMWSFLTCIWLKLWCKQETQLQ